MSACSDQPRDLAGGRDATAADAPPGVPADAPVPISDAAGDAAPAAYTIGGTVAGLMGTGLVLQNNGGDDLVVDGDGTFVFSTPLTAGSTYAVTVLGGPAGEACMVSGGMGTVSASDVTTVVVECSCPPASQCNRACVDIQTDVASCGSCGNTCAPGQTCVAGACTCGSASVSYSAEVQPILTASCASIGCHGGAFPAQGLDLTAASSYNALVNIPSTQCAETTMMVLPGQPEQSYLIAKLIGVDMCAGGIMPLGGASLPSNKIQPMADWICSGAPNN